MSAEPLVSMAGPWKLGRAADSGPDHDVLTSTRRGELPTSKRLPNRPRAGRAMIGIFGWSQDSQDSRYFIFLLKQIVTMKREDIFKINIYQIFQIHPIASQSLKINSIQPNQIDDLQKGI